MKQGKEPTKFQARLSGAFDVDPLDSEEIVPGDQVVIVAYAKAKAVGLVDDEKSGEATWETTLRIRTAGIVRDPDVIDQIASELGVVVPAKLPFSVALDEDDDDDDDDELPAPPAPPPAATRDAALAAFLKDE